MMSLSEEDNKEDILALALSNVAAGGGGSVSESSSGLLDFLNIDPVVDNTILPVVTTSVVNPVIANPVQRLPSLPQEDDNLMDMLGLSDDKLDTISNNELDSLLEEASKIEVPKEVEMVFNSPSIIDSNKEFKLPQQEIKLPQALPSVPVAKFFVKSLPNVTKPVVTNLVAPSTASNVTSKFSVTEAFKVLGTTAKPVVNLKGQQLINLLNTSIVNTSVAGTSSSLNLPVLSLTTTLGTTSPAITTIDRR